MKYTTIFLAIALAATAGERKPLPGQAGNDDIELVASVIVNRDEIRQALGGSDLGEGYVAVRIKVMPKADDKIRVSPDDFTLLSRKDGERSPALSAYQIAGRGAMVVKRATTTQTVGTDRTGPVWGGIGGGGIGRLPGSGGNMGTGGRAA